MSGTSEHVLQNKSDGSSGHFGQDSEVSRVMTPPSFGFADAGGGDPPVQRQESGGGGAIQNDNEQGGDGSELLPAARAAFAGVAGAAGAANASTDPPNKFEKVNDRTNNKLSDAIIPEVNAAVATVQTLTGQDIGTGFGDTTRRLGSTTTKRGADNFSWHKTGRAVDFNQGLRWVIAKDPSGSDMYFRLYLKASQQGPAEGDAPLAEGAKFAHPSPYAKQFDKATEADSIHHNGVGNALWKNWMIDVTSILEANGLERIKAHSDWKTNYNGREWWHYVNDGGLSWYQALAQIYTEQQIIDGVKTFATRRHTDAARLKREGFPDNVLKSVWGNTKITKNGFGLYFSVGSNYGCANMTEDVTAVRNALIQLKIADNANIAVMITAFQTKKGYSNPDGYITVGKGTHAAIGKDLQAANP
ncbi:MAG TPA: hypothetical protein ENJ82_02465 [Bacteroidetes bacterium]|nr:hypothetical protein [Bacteroidota bacterium]